MNYLAPSVLSADFSILGQEIETVVRAGARMVHLDVMDGSFVPNISFGAPVISSVRKNTDALFDVHLMIDEPARYLEDFHRAGADLITVHYEACADAGDTLMKVRELGIRAGLAISPDTPVEVLEPYMELVDLILVMSVYPGFGGQQFIEDSLTRVKVVKEMAQTCGRDDLWIEVDGGIGPDNIVSVMKAGANVLVAGSAVFRGDSGENVRRLMTLLEEQG
ncbi:MAG: ribulose-phosphate 3-epimerase [Lachnospiraceae bacterium]|nr:ribulose-phosphate 3-epimerase [Lachnospiraceae bacterium]